MFDVCTTSDTVHIDTILKFLPHTLTRAWHEDVAVHEVRFNVFSLQY